MKIDEIYDKVLPYLSDPKAIKDFLEIHRKSDIKDLIKKIEEMMSETTPLQKTDLRILLNALSKEH